VLLNISQNGIIMLFQTRQHLISQRSKRCSVPNMTYNVFGGTLNLAQSNPSVVFTGSVFMALKRAVLLVMRRGCRLGDGQSYCRRPKWPPLAAMPRKLLHAWWSSPPRCLRHHVTSAISHCLFSAVAWRHTSSGAAFLDCTRPSYSCAWEVKPSLSDTLVVRVT